MMDSNALSSSILDSNIQRRPNALYSTLSRSTLLRMSCHAALISGKAAWYSRCALVACASEMPNLIAAASGMSV